jgi:hypothetical protein
MAMNKKIMIPTDFSIESLTMVKTLMNQKPANVVYEVVLLHGLELKDSLADLLFFSKTKMLSSLSNAQFEEACDLIQNKFVNEISDIKTDIFSGTTQTSFDNYLEKHQIDEIYLPENYTLNFKNKKSFDLFPFIENSNLKAKEVFLEYQDRTHEKGNLAILFFN